MLLNFLLSGISIWRMLKVMGWDDNNVMHDLMRMIPLMTLPVMTSSPIMPAVHIGMPVWQMLKIMRWNDEDAITHVPLQMHDDVTGLDEGHLRCDVLFTCNNSRMTGQIFMKLLRTLCHLRLIQNHTFFFNFLQLVISTWWIHRLVR
jgi:hypothetical protein